MEQDSHSANRYKEVFDSDLNREFSFERVISRFRRYYSLQILKENAPNMNILEIGCGPEPLFPEVERYERYVVVEPIPAYAAKAANLAIKFPRVTVITDYIESAAKRSPIMEISFDRIILSGVLHEVPDPGGLLEMIWRICKDETLVYISIPNAKSFHRLLALEMGLIRHIQEPSLTDIRFDRTNRFDRTSFSALLDKQGFKILQFATYFVKPFTNDQMEAIVNQGIVDRSIVQGLDRMIQYMPDLGAEMYAVVQKK
jgi:SAM-dependent methyltransferase